MKKHFIIAITLLTGGLLSKQTMAQTDADGIMLKKNLFCIGATYSYSSWKDYWEGTFKRDNENLGKVSTQMIGIMGNYGITDRLNFLFSVPYVKTKASGGTLRGLDGVQDLSLMLKYMPLYKKLGNKSVLSAFVVGGVSTPLTDYVADFQPLSIGMHSTNVSGRAMLDFQYGKWFATASAMYAKRSNVEIDRNSYYTTEMHLTNIVDMPDVFGYNGRAGFRSKRLIVEGMVDHMKTLGGFDIRKNDMPFPSNEMIATMAGIGFKYSSKEIKGLEITGSAKYTVKGRNVGQATMYGAGIFYIFNFSGKSKPYINSKSKPA